MAAGTNENHGAHCTGALAGKASASCVLLSIVYALEVKTVLKMNIHVDLHT